MRPESPQVGPLEYGICAGDLHALHSLSSVHQLVELQAKEVEVSRVCIGQNLTAMTCYCRDPHAGCVAVAYVPSCVSIVFCFLLLCTLSFRIRGKIAEPHSKIMSRTTQLARLQVNDAMRAVDVSPGS